MMHPIRTPFTRRHGLLCLLLLVAAHAAAQAPWTAHGRLLVSANGRFLQHSNGTPFFYLGDTGWQLFKNVNRADVETYLENRRLKGFNVIQAVALDEWPGPGTASVMGDLPFNNLDPTSPRITPGADPADATQYDYWDHVDYIVERAAAKGMYIGFLPSWGNHLEGTMFNTTNARTYGQFLANRYKDKPNIIWIMGGDRNPDETIKQKWNAMAEGIKGLDGNHLMTFHPMGPGKATNFFPTAPWMDFNMIQTGHRQRDWDISYTYIQQDYALTPAKPTFDGEPRYENHDINWNAANGYFDDYDVRQAAYWSLFAGAFGHTYGAKPIWYFGGTFNGKDWRQAMDLPGAYQMTEVKDLMLSRPFLSRVPDQSLISGDAGLGADHMQATRGADYAFIYFSTGQTKSVNLGKVSGTSVKAWWYNPRTGAATLINTYANSGILAFDPPGTQARGNDWVLVLDDASRNYPAPGSGTPIADTQAPTVPGGLASSNVTSSSFTLTWTAATDNVGVTGYDVYRGTTFAGSSNTTSFNVTGLAASTAYAMTVRAKDAAGNVSAASTALTVTTSAASGTTYTKVTGTAFGTAAWSNCPTCSFDKAFDGNTATYFDANDANGAYTGIDAGSGKTVTRIRYYPRSTDPGRMIGGKFQGSNTSSSAGFVDLYTVPIQPTVAWQEVDILNTTAYRYLRYLSPAGGYGNVAEVEFYAGGTTTTPPPAGTTYVSDLTWVSATNGHGPVEKDKSNGENLAGDGRTITLNGVTYAKGLGVHAASEVVYNLGGAYTSFLSDIGIDDWIADGTCGTVVFEVYLDNVLAYTSGTMTPTSATRNVNISVAGKNQLKLVVTIAGDNNYCDHADWANARLTSGGARIAAERAGLTEAVTLSPNPARDQVRVDFTADATGNASVTVANALAQGQLRLEKAVVRGHNSFTLPVSTLRKGLYFVVVQVDGKRITRKLVVE